MERLIAVLDFSSSCPHRAEQLVQRIHLATCGLPRSPGMSWGAERLPDYGKVGQALATGKYWLVFCHSNPFGEIAAAILGALRLAQEKRHLPMAIVAYGGGGLPNFPKPTAEEARRHMTTIAALQSLGERCLTIDRPVEDFEGGAAARWRFDLFLEKAANVFPDLAKSREDLLQCLFADSASAGSNPAICAPYSPHQWFHALSNILDATKIHLEHPDSQALRGRECDYCCGDLADAIDGLLAQVPEIPAGELGSDVRSAYNDAVRFLRALHPPELHPASVALMQAIAEMRVSCAKHGSGGVG